MESGFPTDDNEDELREEEDREDDDRVLEELDDELEGDEEDRVLEELELEGVEEEELEGEEELEEDDRVRALVRFPLHLQLSSGDLQRKQRRFFFSGEQLLQLPQLPSLQGQIRLTFLCLDSTSTAFLVVTVT